MAWSVNVPGPVSVAPFAGAVMLTLGGAMPLCGLTTKRIGAEYRMLPLLSVTMPRIVCMPTANDCAGRFPVQLAWLRGPRVPLPVHEDDHIGDHVAESRGGARADQGAHEIVPELATRTCPSVMPVMVKVVGGALGSATL